MSAAYTVQRNWKDKPPQLRADLQVSNERYFQEHTFIGLITTTPQSIHTLIQAQTNQFGVKGILFTSRNRIEIANPTGNSNASAIIYVGRYGNELYPSTNSNLPASPAPPLPNYTINVGGILLLGAGVATDFWIACAASTADVIFTEIG